MKQSLPRQDSVASPTLADFLRRNLTGGDDERFWLSLALAIGGVASAAFVVAVLRQPDAIQSDARQFLSWMGRWDGAQALNGDLMADFWRSVSPWFFAVVYRAAWLVGIPPLVFAKLLPIPLFPAAAYFAFRFLRAIDAEPLVAFIGAALAIDYLAASDTLASATPRCFWPVLLLALLHGLARRRVLATALPQLLIAGSYPQLALVTAGMIGLTLIDPVRRRLDLGRHGLLLIGAAAAATAIGLAPFAFASHAFGPPFTLDEARNVSAFLPGGRSSVIKAGGYVNFFCGRRTGLFDCNTGREHWLFWPSAFLSSAGPAILFLRSATDERSPVAGMRTPLPLYLALSSLVWFGAAAVMLFQLHLPNRYSGTLLLVGLLVTPPLLVEWTRRRDMTRWLTARGGYHTVVRCALVVLALAAGAANLDPRLLRPARADLIASIRALPADTVVAGFTADLDFSPIFTNRPTLFSSHLAIAYQKGYFTRLNQHMTDMRDAVLTHDPAVLAERLGRDRVDVLVLPSAMLTHPKIPRPFRGFFGRDLQALEAQAVAGGPTALARLAEPCLVGRFDPDVELDARCLMRAAASEAASR